MPYIEELRELIKIMREELTSIGFNELITAGDVDDHMEKNKKGTTLVVFNSICASASGQARPGIRIALEQNGKKPGHLVSVFAGQDKEATTRVREYMPDVPPSSPAFALFKDGELVYFLPRHRIEGRDTEDLSTDLQAAFNAYC